MDDPSLNTTIFGSFAVASIVGIQLLVSSWLSKNATMRQRFFRLAMLSTFTALVWIGIAFYFFIALVISIPHHVPTLEYAHRLINAFEMTLGIPVWLYNSFGFFG